MKKVLIALEGLPGSGKTILGQKLAVYFDGLYIPETVSTNKYNPDQDEYYVESEYKKIELFEKSTKKFNFLDRSFNSMFAYNFGKMKHCMDNILGKLRIKFAKMPEPNLYIYLKIDDVTLCNQRKGISGRNPIWVDNDILKHIREFYENFFSIKNNVFVVPVDKLNIENSFKLIVSKIIEKYGK